MGHFVQSFLLTKNLTQCKVYHPDFQCKIFCTFPSLCLGTNDLLVAPLVFMKGTSYCVVRSNFKTVLWKNISEVSHLGS